MALPEELPKLREDITIRFGEYSADGNPQWLIHDIGRNKFFMIGWIEYECLKRWDLRKPDKIIEAINTETTLHVTQHDLESLLYFLMNQFLIQQSSKQISHLAKTQKLFKNENILRWLIYSYL